MKSCGRQLRHDFVPIGLDPFSNPNVARLGGMLDNLGSPSQRRLDPVLAFPFAVVTGIQPDMAQPGKLFCCALYYEHHAITIHDVSWMHLGFEHEALGIDEQMPFAPFDFLACVIAARATQTNGFDTLAVDDACTWLRFTAHLCTRLLTQCGMKPFPQTLLPPQTKIVIDRFPGRQIVRQQAPCASASQQIEHSIDDFTLAMKTRSPMKRGHRKQRSDAVPFRIAQVSKIVCSMHDAHCITCAPKKP